MKRLLLGVTALAILSWPGLISAQEAQGNQQTGGGGQLGQMTQKQGDWVMAGRTYDLQRFSPLREITAANVKDLKAAWSFSTGTLRGHEGAPLVLNNTMYVHTSFPNIVYALDLTKEGAPMKWKHVPDQPADVIPIACCD
ncbi:MAG: PQQ-dependent dehydrogenase, methanol/ethanol family, partial [Gemmatimonadetes bacterium]|nr:PQQ-dependent dehydrogenase, methanol/ethanol family [Gemmatimonadota bacterium]